MPALVNLGRQVNFITGIAGVSAGSQAVLNLATNQRYHRLIFQCSALNYTGGTALPIVALTGTGTGATITPTISNGRVTGGTIVAGGSGWNVGDTFTFTDLTGTGFVGTVATVTGGPPGALTTFAVTVGGTPSPIDPEDFFSGFKMLVNGVNMRDIDVVDILKRNILNGQQPRLGELDVFFTEPWRNVAYLPEATSWDVFGQSTFQLQMGIKGTVDTPGLVGVMEFDYQRNAVIGADGKETLFLQPISLHGFGWPLVAGRNDINTLPFNYPILRMLLQGSVPGSIYQVELFQDGNKICEFTEEQLRQTYEPYGFELGKPNYYNQSYGSVDAVTSALAEPRYYDAATIMDPDQALGKALRVGQSMILRVYSSVSQQLTVIQESLPGSFSSN